MWKVLFFFLTAKMRVQVNKEQREREREVGLTWSGDHVFTQVGLELTQCGTRTHEPWNHDLSQSQMLNWATQVPGSYSSDRFYFLSEVGSKAYDVTHMWNLTNKTNKQRGKKERERGKPRNRLLTIQNKVRVTRGGGGWRDGLYRWWGLRTALVISTRCCIEMLNHHIVYLKPILHVC